MAKKKKEREITNPDEVADKLGYGQAIQTPDGESVKTEEPTEAEVKTPVEEEEVQETEETTEAEITEEVSQEKPTEEQRRTWQSERDSAIAEKTKAEQEVERQKLQVQALQQVNQQMMNVIQPFQQKYQAPQQTQEQTGPPKADFIVDGFFDPAKYDEYQRQRDEYVIDKASQKASQSYSQQRDRETMGEQLDELTEEFPEYINPLTGQADVERLEKDIRQHQSKKRVVDIVKEMRGVKKDPSFEKTVEAIEKNASRPSSVTESAEAAEKVKTEIPEELKKLHKTFGNVELPEDFDGLE